MKKYKVQYTPAAIEHISNIATWYNKIQKGLGDRFKTNLKKEINLLKNNPFIHSFRYDEVRFAIPGKFPYAAHYTIDEEILTVIIHTVFAFKEDPGNGKFKRIIFIKKPTYKRLASFDCGITI